MLKKLSTVREKKTIKYVYSKPKTFWSLPTESKQIYAMCCGYYLRTSIYHII